MEQLHHMNRGKCRVSTTLTDRQMFEALYSYAVEFIWVAFGRRDRDLIETEVGRLLRSGAFNRALRKPTNVKTDKGNLMDEDQSVLETKSCFQTKDGKILKDSQILGLIDNLDIIRNQLDKKSHKKKKSSPITSVSRKSAASEMSLKNRSKSVEDGKEIDGAEMMT